MTSTEIVELMAKVGEKKVEFSIYNQSNNNGGWAVRIVGPGSFMYSVGNSLDECLETIRERIEKSNERGK
jgi:hypothetical protein